MFKRWFMVAWLVLMSVQSGNLSAQPTTRSNDAPISPFVWTATEDGASASFLVVLRDQADVSRAASLPDRAGRGQAVYETLREMALRTQAPLRAELDRLGVHYRAFYIVNMLELTAGRDLVLKLASRPDVARIEANPQVSNLKSQISSEQTETFDRQFTIENPQSVEWNIQKVNAPDVWNMGYTGQGVVVAGADTGYQWDHPALKQRYRGWNGITVTHDYNWHDAIHDAVGDACGNNSPTPCDPYGHGTHTMGTMVGDDGAGNQVGMAPGAQWMGCRNMDWRGYGTPARYIECFEFFLAPYPIGGDPVTQGVPALAPAVIGNSWSCPPSEGCSSLTLQEIVNTVRAAGIEVVGAAQNAGPSCSTIADPIGIYAGTFTVGATDSGDGIAGFSSRGPITADGSYRRKPDISAPGVSVRSSVPGGGYSFSSGTSMATPHVAGLFALLWSAAPGLRGNLAATEAVITGTAVHLTTTQGCGGDASTTVPNNVYGWGRIDALAATQVISSWPSLRMAVSAPAGLVLPARLFTSTLVVANPSSLTANEHVTVTDKLPLNVEFASASDNGVFSPTTGEVMWLVPMLAPQSAVTLTLGVTASIVPSGTLISNDAYGALSDQVTRVVSGLPVTTRVSGWAYVYYLPVFPVSP